MTVLTFVSFACFVVESVICLSRTAEYLSQPLARSRRAIDTILYG